jgi:CRISPR/Cas system CSM-associated protein Csm3 (group 7 of RAMP superfamily)
MTDAGYDFVPLARDVHRCPRPETHWDRRAPDTLSGYIDITLTAEQPLHIGSGSKEHRAPHVILRGAAIRGGPGIPGSSLKGVLRARYEAITRSCTSLSPGSRRIKVRSSSTPIRWAQLTGDALRTAVFAERCTEHSMCPACALFGRMSLRSRITVTDLACTGDTAFQVATIPERFGPNLHHVGSPRIAGDIFEVTTLKGRKFHCGRGPAAQTLHHVESIPAGAVLAGQLRLRNATPAELGGLLAALGCDPPSALKLGGGKAQGFGRARCRARCALTAHGDAALDPVRWRQAFVASSDRWADGEARLVALHSGGC